MRGVEVCGVGRVRRVVGVEVGVGVGVGVGAGGGGESEVGGVGGGHHHGRLQLVKSKESVYHPNKS